MGKNVGPRRIAPKGPHPSREAACAEVPRLQIKDKCVSESLQGADPEALDALSRDRLEGFRDASTDSDKLLVGRYLLNAAVSEALHPHLHALEVVLRNRLTDAAAAAYPVDPDLPNEYDDFPVWLDATPGILITEHRKIVAQAKAKVFGDLRRRFGPTKGSAKRLRTPGRLVAALPFSFWVFLFDTDYSGDRTGPGPLWPDLFNAVFPHCSGVGLSTIRKRLRRLLVLRNRAMHYERILPYTDSRDLPWDPDQIVREVGELIGWMSPRTAAVVERFDRMPEVLHPTNVRLLRLVPWGQR